LVTLVKAFMYNVLLMVVVYIPKYKHTHTHTHTQTHTKAKQKQTNSSDSGKLQKALVWFKNLKLFMALTK